MFQEKGKNHIRYIQKIATQYWVDYKYQIDFSNCLSMAFQSHLNRLKNLIEVERQIFVRNQK